MFAMVGIFSMDSPDEAIAHALVPDVEAMPGFVQAIWSVDRDAGMSYAMIVFDTREHAQAVVARVRAGTYRRRSQGFHLERLAVAECVPSASR